MNPPSITMTASRCAPDTAHGRHVFEIAGYSLTKGIGAGNFIQSTPTTGASSTTPTGSTPTTTTYTITTPDPMTTMACAGQWGFGMFKLRSDLERSVFPREDRLVIQCDISVVTGMAVVSSRSEPVL
ncbi:unnamed protein product [Urochloa decumbens]|uniref:Uncharacterized protein n=1 Tax=Urochloa decumbens TaxID=240449 RepID=A0ABC9BKE1_9POAL